MTFEALGKDWTLRFTTNALCRVEEATGRGVAEIAAGLSDGVKVRDLRVLFWGGVSGITQEQAGDIIDDIGFQRAGELIGQAFQAAFPQEEAEGNGAATAA